MQERVEPLRDLGKLHPLRLEDLGQQVVAVDELALVGILERGGLQCYNTKTRVRDPRSQTQVF